MHMLISYNRGSPQLKQLDNAGIYTHKYNEFRLPYIRAALIGTSPLCHVFYYNSA